MALYCRSKLNHTPAMPHLLSLLHHCLLLPVDYGSSPQHWLLFDRNAPLPPQSVPALSVPTRGAFF